ncbi:MAG: mobile mystery protein B [Rhizobiaceae bacterium]
MSELFEGPEDATPLEPAEREGLIPSWVTQRSELNEVEQDNILKGAAWAKSKRGLSSEAILNMDFVKNLHARMFGEVWAWAGQFRKTERNIGIAAIRIPQELRNTIDDVRYWIEHKANSNDEIAVRLHHRLVSIHPFPNGNGRHTRMMADLLIQKLGDQPFSWGSESLLETGPLRARYVEALQAADGHDIRPLIAFARS